MGIRRNFARGYNVGILLILFRLLTIQCRWRFTKRFTLSTSQKNFICYGKSHKNCTSLAAAYFSFMPLLTQYENYMPSRYQQSLSRCIYCHTCLQTTIKCTKTFATVTWSEPLNICCHVTVTQWRPTLEQSDCKFRNLPLQTNEWTWMNCKLIIASHQDSEGHKEDCKLITRVTKVNKVEDFRRLSNFVKRAQVKFHAETRSDSRVMWPKKSIFFVKSKFSCSRAFLFIDILLKLQ